jgi:hypothetical protein
MPGPNPNWHPCFLPRDWNERVRRLREDVEYERAKRRSRPVKDEFCDEPAPDDFCQLPASDQTA